MATGYRNGFNNFTIPWANELTANQYNAATNFGGNTPVSFINYSLGTLQSLLQQQPSAPKTGNPDDFEPVVINGRTVLRRKQTVLDQVIGTPPFNPNTQGGDSQPPGAGKNILDILLGRPASGPIIGKNDPVMKSDGRGTMGDDLSKSAQGPAEIAKALSGVSDLSTRTIVVIIGIVLLLGAFVLLK